MSSTIIAVLGTLAGAVVAGLMQQLTTARAERAAQAERRRQALVEAVPGLLAALVEYRGHQYMRLRSLQEHVPETPEERKARYASRGAVTHAMDRLYMATRDQALLDAAQAAMDTTFAFEPHDRTDDAVGEQAREAHSAFRLRAAVYVYDHR
ncbi:hypothetical protein [Streptomyces sp. NPDC002889]|uniref:hypothetical protein n=1 Tax=Streptomyces sp. NPDC002889 TaxID=3364669 RepID=UPI0036873DC7